MRQCCASRAAGASMLGCCYTEFLSVVSGEFTLQKKLVDFDDLVLDHETVRLASAKLEATVVLGKVIFDLGDLLERHIRREERELFPLFEQHAAVIGADEIAEKLVNFFELARRSQPA